MCAVGGWVCYLEQSPKQKLFFVGFPQIGHLMGPQKGTPMDLQIFHQWTPKGPYHRTLNGLLEKEPQCLNSFQHCTQRNLN